MRFFLILPVVALLISAKTISRSKRQLRLAYICNGMISNYPCSNTQQSNEWNNCNTVCGNINCNQFNLSPCNQKCCNNQIVSSNTMGGLYNPYSNGLINSFGNDLYNPYQTILSVGSQFGNQIQTSGANSRDSDFTGIIQNGIYLCGGSEPSGGRCDNGRNCPFGHSCVAGNVCCHCPVGASNGMCNSDIDCPAGTECSVTGYCCAVNYTPGASFHTCVNGVCLDDEICGYGNICYPKDKFRLIRSDRCTNGKCEEGYFCLDDGYCYKTVPN